MAKEYGIFTREEAAELRRLLHRVRTQIGNPVQRPPTPEFPQNDQLPVVYIARTPSSGIPAYTLLETGTGNIPILNSAVCEIWRIPDDGQLVQVQNFHKKVWSFYDFDIPGDTFVLVKHEGYGKWMAEWFDQGDDLDTGTGTGTGTSVCDDLILYERKTECEPIGTSETEGEENEYIREVRVNIDENGCLQKTVGEWEYTRTKSCCDPSCATDTGTGTGEGETIPNVCDPCNPKPMQMSIDVDAVTDKTCTDCEQIGSKTYTVTHTEECIWSVDTIGDPCDIGQEWNLALSIDAFGKGTAHFGGQDIDTVYEKENWECHAAAVFTKVSEGTSCNMPDTITVTPV